MQASGSLPEIASCRPAILAVLEHEIARQKTPSAVNLYSVTEVARFLGTDAAFCLGPGLRLIVAASRDGEPPVWSGMALAERPSGAFEVDTGGQRRVYALWCAMGDRRNGGLMFRRTMPWGDEEARTAVQLAQAIGQAHEDLKRRRRPALLRLLADSLRRPLGFLPGEA